MSDPAIAFEEMVPEHRRETPNQILTRGRIEGARLVLLALNREDKLAQAIKVIEGLALEFKEPAPLSRQNGDNIPAPGEGRRES